MFLDLARLMEFYDFFLERGTYAFDLSDASGTDRLLQIPAESLDNAGAVLVRSHFERVFPKEVHIKCDFIEEHGQKGAIHKSVMRRHCRWLRQGILPWLLCIGFLLR